MFAISRHFEASVGISTYCTQHSLPKKRKGPDKCFIEDVAVLSESDGDKYEEEEEDEDNNEYSRDDFVIDDGAEEEEDESSMPHCHKDDDLEDSDEEDDGNESKGRKC